MVNIQLDEHWNLESDFRQWILARDTKHIYFFTDLEHAIQSFFELKTRCSQARTMQGLIDCQKTALSSLKQALAPLKVVIITQKVDEIIKDEKEQ